MNALEQFKAIDIIPSGSPLICFNLDEKLVYIMKELIEHHKISAPIFKGSISDKSNLKTSDIQGIVSTIDIVTHLSEVIADTSSMSFDLKEVYADSERELIQKVTVEQLFEKSITPPLIIDDPSISLYDLMETMEKNKSRHAIISSEGKVLQYITQSDILRALADHTSILQPILNRTLKDLGYKPKEVHTITTKNKAIDAFKLIKDLRVNAVGVVDENGKLVGNISSSDIKLIDHDAKYIHRLFNNAEIFIIKVQQFNKLSGGVETCKIDDQLSDVIKKLQERKIHRLYVVDNENKPVSVLSISDLYTLMKE